MRSRSLTETEADTETTTKQKPQKANTKLKKRKTRAGAYGQRADYRDHNAAEHYSALERHARTSSAAKDTLNKVPRPSAIRLSKLGFQPIERIRNLPEYAAAGLRDADTSKYLPSLSITTVEEFLGLIRGAPKELAEDLGTSEDKLIDLYNAAIASQLPSISSETVEDLLAETYSFGLPLEAPPELTDAALAVTPDIEMDMAASESLEDKPELQEESVSLIDQHMPPIRNQGKRGTCVAFSTCAVMEYMSSTAGKPAQHLSVQYLYWLAKGRDRYPKEGTWLTYSFPVAKEQGTCKELLWPYEPDFIAGDLTHGNPPDGELCRDDASTNTFARAIRIRDYREPRAIKEQLAQGRPVAIAIPVFKSWYDDVATRLSGNIHLPLKSDRFALSGHALVLVGYGDDELEPGGGYFIVRNSWGEGWARDSPFGAGYGYISYGYIQRFNADAWTGTV